MKKRVTSLLLTLAMLLSLLPTTALAASDVALDSTNFPDDNFRTYIGEKYDTDKNGSLSSTEIAAIKSLDVSDKEIKNLKGIEFFTEMDSLYCYKNQLTALDVSQNSKLTKLFCYQNPLTELDVSENPKLTMLRCDFNLLTELDVSNNPELEGLNCSSNQLTALDVSKNSKLTGLYCDSNPLTKLDVSQNSKLTELYCYQNQLTALDVSQNPELKELACYYNELTALDVSRNTQLTYLNCTDNQLTALDVSKNLALIELRCTDNQLTALDVSKNLALKYLYCISNQLTELDVSKNLDLRGLYCYKNSLTSLDLSKNPKITTLKASGEYQIDMGGKDYFDLRTLPGNFDVEKTSNWTGGTLNGNILTVDSGETKVTYDYATGRENSGTPETVKFTLTVKEAPPTPTLTGNVYYTSSIVYGRSISTGTSGTPAEATKAYQWQRSKDGGKWTDIDGANKGSYIPTEADMGANVSIRVVVTANGYLGEIVGAAVKVSKAANNNYPEVIQLEAVKNGAGNYNGFKITNFDSDCEYVYSTTDTPNWSANQITSDTVTGLTSDKTYHVFARFKETDTQTVGSIVSRNSIGLYEFVPLQYVLLEGYSGGETIYIEQGKSVTLKVSADPSSAISWKTITFKDDNGGATSNIKIDNAEIAASTGTATPFPNDHSITITGVSRGRATLKASYPGPNNYYGTWNVVVYDDSHVADALRLESVYAYEDITLSENDTAELPTTNLLKLLPENSGYHLEWRILERGATSTGFTHVTENENIKLEDGKIKPEAAHTGSEKAQLELVAVKDGSTEYKTLPKTSHFYVTVTEAPTITLTGVTVAPKKVNLDIGKNITLSAVKEPVNATGDLIWTSDKPAVATVDNTGKVTAVAAGTATIKVTCGGMEDTCTVTVDHTHDTEKQPWVYKNPDTHTKTCTAGDDTKYAPHNWQWVVDTHATSTTAGKKHEECPDCHAKRSEHTEIPATGGGSSSGSGSTGGGGGGGGAGVTTYVITVQNSKNGAVTASHKSAAKDTAVTLTVTPDKGYALDTLTVLDSKDKAVKLTQKNGKYTFTMPNGKVTVSAAFKAAAPASENPFTDVPSGAYYEDAVIWAVKKDITSGTSATTFNPDGNCTRAQAVTFLWRAAGSPEPKSATMPFTDVPAGSYFEKAVLWAVENGITKGTSDTTFTPDASCTRAQIVTFLWRANGSHAVSGNSAFSDVAADAYYAAAVAWAEKNGVTGGIGGGLFGSDNNCTRAQIVTFLYRAMK